MQPTRRRRCSSKHAAPEDQAEAVAAKNRGTSRWELRGANRRTRHEESTQHADAARRPKRRGGRPTRSKDRRRSVPALPAGPSSLGNLDPKTGEVTYYPLAPQFNDVRVQLNFTGLRHDVDGKVWTKSVGTQDIFRVDLASGNWEKFHPTDALPPGRRYGIYQVISDSHNNLWMAEFDDGHLGKLDAKTLQVTWYTPPTLHSRMRRLEIDDQDRLTIAEYRGNKVAVFDPKTEQFTEYSLPPYTFPYRAQFDKNGELWSSTMSTDRVVRTDPKTGTSVEYLMPSDTNMRTVALDNSTSPVTFWVGSNHDHSLVKVEPLDAGESASN